MQNEKIYVIPKQLKYLNNMFTKKKVPLPGLYISEKKNMASAKYIVNYPIDIGNKKYQTYFKSLDFFPTTFFAGDHVDAENNSIYFYKEDDKEYSEGITVMLGKDLPSVVPKNIIIQKEIKPYLYNGLKFDIRVLCCVRRDGTIYFYKNLHYRFCSTKYTENISIDKQLTVGEHLFKNNGNKLVGFFQYDVTTIMDYSNYIIQLKNKLKEIYNKILPFANSTISDDLSNKYMILGMDFIPDSNNNLYFLELNSVPGWKTIYGIHNYRIFYNEITKFILKKKINPTYGEILYL
jgi:hypothetical protein